MAKLPDDLKITWLGHATFVVQYGDKRLIIDPWVTENPRCPDDSKDVGDVDLILVTHGHGDHVGDLVALGRKNDAPIVGIVELANWVNGKDVRGEVIEMNKGGTVQVAGVKVHMTHAVHSAGIEDGQQVIYGGEPAGYVIEFPDGFKLYHSGDTALMADHAIIGKMLAPDWAMLCIGDHYTMGPRSAAEAARMLGITAVIPMHYGTFPVLVGTPDELRHHLDGDDIEVVSMEPGQTI